MAKKLTIARHESFPLREGWIAKALDAMPEYGKQTFNKEDGISILGIGANMVKSLKYWLLAGGILKGVLQITFTSYGEALLKHDPYMSKDLSWYLYHYYLTSSLENAPVFYYVFHLFDKEQIDKKALFSQISSYLNDNQYSFNEKSLEKDLNVFFASYYREELNLNPEENNVSPLTRLLFFSERNVNGNYVFRKQSFQNGFSILLLYLLGKLYGDSFNLDDAFYLENSPAKSFHLSQQLFNEYLSELNALGLIRVDRTAGLNVAYILKKLDLDDLYQLWNERGGR